jgi:hypothetical protein
VISWLSAARWAGSAHGLIACAALPRLVAAAVPPAGGVADEDVAGAERAGGNGVKPSET